MLGFQRAEQPACPTFPGSAFMFGVQPICPSVLRYHRPRPSPGQGLKKDVVLLNWEVQTTPPPRDPDRPLGGGYLAPPKKVCAKTFGLFFAKRLPKKFPEWPFWPILEQNFFDPVQSAAENRSPRLRHWTEGVGVPCPPGVVRTAAPPFSRTLRQGKPCRGVSGREVVARGGLRPVDPEARGAAAPPAVAGNPRAVRRGAGPGGPGGIRRRVSAHCRGAWPLPCAICRFLGAVSSRVLFPRTTVSMGLLCCWAPRHL